MKTLMPLFAAAALLLTSLPTIANPLEITEAKLGKGVEDREIVDETTMFATGDKAYLWMRVVGGPSDPITVTWSIDDHTDTVSLKVGGSSWRTWANKTLWKAGQWTATVKDADDQVLKEITFTVE